MKEGCIAVHPSDTAPALIALDARIRTSKRTIAAENFFRVEVSRTTVLEPEEIVTAIQIPKPQKGTKSAFFKFALRKSIDFPIVNCAARISTKGGKVTDARICLNGVYVKPLRAMAAEDAITGKKIKEADAQAAGEAAVAEAKPLQDNGYMVEVAKTLVKKAILKCG